MSNEMISGLLGAIVGAIIPSLVSIYLFKRQLRFESNRRFLEQLIEELQKIYIAQQSRNTIGDESINILNAFQIILYKDLDMLRAPLEELKNAILEYRTQKDRGLGMTTIPAAEIQATNRIKTSIDSIMQKIRDIT